MPFVKDLLASIVNYRLGYVPTRPYAWRWTTPVALAVFLVATIILVLINVPLSAYTIVTEATYTPNSSLPALPLSGLVPSILQDSSYSGAFSPQTLTQGQIIRPNGSIYSYVIAAAYDGLDTSQPVSSFAYYNNPLSDSCDITNMTINAQLEGSIQASVQITCWKPTLYILSFDIQPVLDILLNQGLSLQSTAGDIRITSLTNFYYDLYETWSIWSEAANGTLEGPLSDVHVPHGTALSGALSDFGSANLTEFKITVRPCCDCYGNGDATWNTGIFSLGYPPCSETPASFFAFDTSVALQRDAGGFMSVFTGMKTYSDFFFASSDNLFNGTEFRGLNSLLHNLFQVLYHSVRLDLGISQPNQIYTSANMYNRSISTVYIPGIFYEGVAIHPGPAYAMHPRVVYTMYPAYANTSRQDSSSLTTLWTAEQQDVVRVPIMSYFRTVPRLKPLGAAITSVFVSTFAMVSVLWQGFSFIAGTLSDKGSDNKEVESLRETVEQMKANFEHMRRGLEKHGLISDDDEFEDMNPWKTSHEEVALMRRHSALHNKTHSTA